MHRSACLFVWYPKCRSSDSLAFSLKPPFFWNASRETKTKYPMVFGSAHTHAFFSAAVTCARRFGSSGRT